MRIEDTSSELLRTTRTQPIRPVGQEQQQTRPEGDATPAPRNDKVQISDAGRALAAKATDAPDAGTLSPERVAELRQKVLLGAYNSVQMVDEVARRILDRGDV
jgi:negative regulator of flagellin synthesis FlgM